MISSNSDENQDTMQECHQAEYPLVDNQEYELKYWHIVMIVLFILLMAYYAKYHDATHAEKLPSYIESFKQDH
jgi:hypothetical protein